MYANLQQRLKAELEEIRTSGLYKTERVITSPQGAEIRLEGGKQVINFCANNYLGLSSHPEVIGAAGKALSTHGYGMSSVRFICGTQDIHKELERSLSRFLGTEDSILYAAAFDANGGVFEPLFGAEDAVISDTLNHASIIDGIRLCKAVRYRYAHDDMDDLENCLKQARAQRSRIIITDGVFSMDGTIARLGEISRLADRYDAIVMIDECHATGFMGKTGRGTHEFREVFGKIDIITGTLGKALGGASGGFTSGRREIIELLRQRSRPYLFSNTLAPSIAGASIKVIELLEGSTKLRDKLMDNAAYFRTQMTAAGFDIRSGIHPIVPIMLYDAPKAQLMAEKLLEEGIFVTGFFYPVVPKDQARIRVQISAAHERHHLDLAIAAFVKIGKELKVIH